MSGAGVDRGRDAARTSAPLQRRMMYTPMRDLVRGRVSGRLDLATSLRDAGLPESTRSLIAGIVRRTRLWPMERTDVAQELTAHFRDALEAGESAAAAEAAFGDPRQTARLIRRAKRRARPLPVRMAIRGFKGAFVIATVYCVFAGGYYLWLRSAEPVVARDYLAELNASALAIPEEERAWPLYRRATTPHLGGNTPSLYPGIGSSAHADVRRNLAGYAENIDMIRRAARMPRLGLVFGESHMVLYESVPPAAPLADNIWLGASMRNERTTWSLAIRLLTQSAYFAELEHEYDCAMDDLITALKVIRHMLQHRDPFTLSFAASYAIYVAERFGDLLALAPEAFTDEQLLEIDAIVREMTPGMLDSRMEYVDVQFADSVQRSYTDDGRGGGRLTLQGLRVGLHPLHQSVEPPVNVLASARGVVLPNRRRLHEAYDRTIATFLQWHDTPLWERAGFPTDIFMFGSIPGVERGARYILPWTLLDRLKHSSIGGHLAVSSLDALRTSIALERFRRAHDRWPVALDELVPDWLEKLPRDPFDGCTLRYRLVDGEPVLHSIGMDRVDRGGVSPVWSDGSVRERRRQEWYPPAEHAAYIAANPPEDPDTEVAKQMPKADWVLFSPALARRIAAQRLERLHADTERDPTPKD